MLMCDSHTNNTVKACCIALCVKELILQKRSKVRLKGRTRRLEAHPCILVDWLRGCEDCVRGSLRPLCGVSSGGCRQNQLRGGRRGRVGRLQRFTLQRTQQRAMHLAKQQSGRDDFPIHCNRRWRGRLWRRYNRDNGLNQRRV